MIAVKAKSTGKVRSKRSFMTMTECSMHPKSQPNSAHKKDYGRPQPIRIKHLLQQYDNVKSNKKDGTRKKILPERLGTSSIKKTGVNEKQNVGTNSTQYGQPHKRVQRHLNFSTCLDTTKHNTESTHETNDLVLDKSVCKAVSKTAKVKRFLLPPNFIKEKYLQNNSRGTSQYSKTHKVLTEMVDERDINFGGARNTEIMKVDTTSSLSSYKKHLNGNIRSTVSRHSIRVHNEPSSIYSNIELSHRDCSQGIETPCNTRKSLNSPECASPKPEFLDNEDQLHVKSNSWHDKFISSPTNERSMQPREINSCINDLCNNMQITNLVDSENNTNIKHRSSDKIYVSRDEIIHLDHNLRILLHDTEQNAQKLRVASACIRRLLLTDNKINSNVNVEKECTELEARNNNMVDQENQLKTETEYLKEQLKTPVAHLPNNKEVDENNKENENVFSRLSNTMDGSFLELETQLNIEHKKPAQSCSANSKLPTIAKYKKKRSLIEYMALKSSMSFLQTPDGKKFKSLCQEGAPDKAGLDFTYISNQLLTNLDNLYADSPDSQL